MAAHETVVVPSISDKFFNTNFDDVLKQKGATNILMVGTRSTGAVLYTAFGANARGYTVAVAVDGISGSIPVVSINNTIEVLPATSHTVLSLSARQVQPTQLGGAVSAIFDRDGDDRVAVGLVGSLPEIAGAGHGAGTRWADCTATAAAP